MELNRILGYRDFHKRNEIIEFIKNKFNPTDKEKIESSEEIILFRTSRQQTWLIVSNTTVYCILDDKEKKSILFKWKMNKEELIDSVGNFNLNISTGDYKGNTGTINFGEQHKGWLYSKKLFQNENDLINNFKNKVNKKFE